MKRLLVVLFCIALCGVARAETLTPRGFAQEFVRALITASSSAIITMPSELEVTIRYPGGRTTSVDLTNAYRLYSSDPARLQEVIRLHVTAVLQPAGTDTPVAAKLDRARIVPVIKTRQWIVDLHNGLKAGGKPQEHRSRTTTASSSSFTRRTASNACAI